MIGLALALVVGATPVRVGSKAFTESVIIGEIARQTLEAHGVVAAHQRELGGTAIAWKALLGGEIDVYPEYSGTIAKEILKADRELDLAGLNAQLAPLGLAASVPLGFQNTYAIGVRKEVADARGVKRVSDLSRHPDLRLGFSHEFLGRQDGWPGLAAAYGLQALKPTSLDHGLAYDALAAGTIDAMDLYSTDAKIERQGIRVLEDERAYFPRYDALFLNRAEAPRTHPQAWAGLTKLEGKIDAATMVRLNARAEIDKRDFATVAAEFLGQAPAGEGRNLWSALFAPDFARLLMQHVALVLGSLVAAIAIGVPLGVAAARVRALAQPVLVVVGVVQTIPSLALLAFLIPLTGTIGVWPATIA
ncbi:MAG: glycine betaine ABC transporter substrate-binding protein, partial [Myxococcota bacterium]